MNLPKLPCQIPLLKLGCFGCCGRLYSEKKEVLLGIKKNTLTWKDEQEKPIAQRLTLKEFCWRQKPLRPCGVCANVIENNERFVCAVHPIRNKSEDVRENYCNTEFLCEAAKEYQEMTDEEKETYISFLAKKVSLGMDSYEYSMLNDKEALIVAFREKHERRAK